MNAIQGNYETEYYDDVDLDCAVLFDSVVFLWWLEQSGYTKSNPEY